MGGCRSVGNKHHVGIGRSKALTAEHVLRVNLSDLAHARRNWLLQRNSRCDSLRLLSRHQNRRRGRAELLWLGGRRPWDDLYLLLDGVQENG
jgi:hypothetical protein